MPTLPPDIVQLFSYFAVAFTAPTFAKAVTLAVGAILAPGRRTVASALRMVGLADDEHFTNYHRVLNRDRWSPWVVSRLLLALLILVFVAADLPIIVLIDDTLERRKGKKIRYKGWFHDAILSTARRVVTSLGLRWLCLAILVPVPWSARPWAVPFMTVLTVSPKTSEKLGKRHRTLPQWAAISIAKVRRWQPEREIAVVGDGSYAVVELVHHCQGLSKPVRLVSRLRLDAVLHAFPGPQPKGKRGPKPKKGPRLLSLAERLDDPHTTWEPVKLTWYGGYRKTVELTSGVSLWYRRGQTPVPIRWVLVRCPKQSIKPAAFFCSDPDVSAEQILQWVIARWNIEVTFEEMRAHLGFETQRQWSDRAIERTTPCLFGLFSLVVVFAKALFPDTLPIRQAEWYPKDEATFSDVLAAVRCQFWKGSNICNSSGTPDMLLIPQSALLPLLEVACYST
jgi:hypothetical protein